ncbi:MAG: hypothetical protein MMC33_002300 [Icmadophila ericetorum]|nr:hypothetical protein [Icmadophila ericetorum]
MKLKLTHLLILLDCTLASVLSVAPVTEYEIHPIGRPPMRRQTHDRFQVRNGFTIDKTPIYEALEKKTKISEGWKSEHGTAMTELILTQRGGVQHQTLVIGTVKVTSGGNSEKVYHWVGLVVCDLRLDDPPPVEPSTGWPELSSYQSHADCEDLLEQDKATLEKTASEDTTLIPQVEFRGFEKIC